MRPTSVRIPAGVAVPDAERCYVLVAGQVEMIDLGSGEVLDRVPCDAEPVAADARHVLAAALPTAVDGGRVVDLRVDESTLTVRSERALLTADVLADAAPFVDRAEVRADVADAIATIVVDVPHRYAGGAAPDDELLARSRFVLRTTIRIDLSTGDEIDRVAERLAPGDARDHPGAHHPGDDDPADLGPGVIHRVLAGNHVVVETVDIDESDGVERRHLRVTDTTGAAPTWRHLIAETPLRPATPPPPPPP